MKALGEQYVAEQQSLPSNEQPPLSPVHVSLHLFCSLQKLPQQVVGAVQP